MTTTNDICASIKENGRSLCVEKEPRIENLRQNVGRNIARRADRFSMTQSNDLSLVGCWEWVYYFYIGKQHTELNSFTKSNWKVDTARKKRAQDSRQWKIYVHWILTRKSAITNCNGPPCTTMELIVVETNWLFVVAFLSYLLYNSRSSIGSISILRFFNLHKLFSTEQIYTLFSLLTFFNWKTADVFDSNSTVHFEEIFSRKIACICRKFTTLCTELKMWSFT